MATEKRDESVSVRRERIGIIFNYDLRWMGGIMYILNLIRTIHKLDDDNRPEIYLFYNRQLSEYAESIDYPYLKRIEWNFPNLYKGYLYSWLSGKNYFISKILDEYRLDALYPVHDFPIRMRTGVKLVSWYADLQHKHYPEFFTWQKRFERNFRTKLMLRNAKHLVVSSQSVENDFRRFYHIPGRLKIHVYHFVSINEHNSVNDNQELRSEYVIPESYFVVSNQFAKHKNHGLVLKAISILKKKGINVYVVFTGKLPDRDYSEYVNELHEIIDREEIEEHLTFTGMMPRRLQIDLMRQSNGVIQPSLFEGWSTVIEDALSIEVMVLASDIPVNREQLGESGLFFDPFQPESLAFLLESFINGKQTGRMEIDYNSRMVEAASHITSIFKQ